MINLSPTLTTDQIWRCVAVTPSRKFEPAFTHPYDAELANDTAAYRDWLLSQFAQPTTQTYKHAYQLALQHTAGCTVILQIHENALHGDILRAALLSLASTLDHQPARPDKRTHAGLELISESIEEQETEIDHRRFVWITGNDGTARLGYVWDAEAVITALVPDFGLIKIGRLPKQREINGQPRNYPSNFWVQRHLIQLTPRVRVAPITDIGALESTFENLIRKQRNAEEFVNERTQSHNPDRYDWANMGHSDPEEELQIEDEPDQLEELHADEFAAYLAFHNEIGTNFTKSFDRRPDLSITKPIIKRTTDGKTLILTAKRQAQGITHLYTDISELIALVNLKTYTGDPAALTYIGRKMQNRDASPLGNPYKLKNESQRGAALDAYKLWLWGKMQSETPALAELRRLAALVINGKKITLACWCSPQPCHGEIVKAAILYLIKNGLVF